MRSCSNYQGRQAGALADSGCLSFPREQERDGGRSGRLRAINAPDLAERAFQVWEYGTNRRAS